MTRRLAAVVGALGALAGALGALAGAIDGSAATGGITSAETAAPSTGPAVRGTLGTLPPVFASSAVLMDARTGATLFAQNADVRRQPASTTKILTAILVLERLRLDEMVSVSPRAAAQRSGSSIGLEAGERWRVEDLLRALLLASANDAAVALAEAAAGSVERFAALMNETARRIGATSSAFVVPHGLYHPQHLTTARDLATITRYALRHPVFASLVRQQTFIWRRHGTVPRVVVNRNRLLWRLPGANGVKTGWIRQSGPCLVASAARGGWQLIAVVLDSPDLFGDGVRLLEYGFAHFRLVRVAARDTVLVRRPVPGAAQALAAAVPEDVFAVLPRSAALRWEGRLRAALAAPIPRGAPVGELIVYADDRVVARAPVVAAEAVAAQSLWRSVVLWMRGLMGRAPRPPRSRVGLRRSAPRSPFIRPEQRRGHGPRCCLGRDAPRCDHGGGRIVGRRAWSRNDSTARERTAGSLASAGASAGSSA